MRRHTMKGMVASDLMNERTGNTLEDTSAHWLLGRIDATVRAILK